MRALKRLLNATADLDTAAAPDRRIARAGEDLGAPNQIEAIRAGVEKRPPRFADTE